MDAVMVMKLGDEDLAATLYAAGDAIDDNEARDRLYFAADELLERLDVDLLRRVRWSELADDPDRVAEMDAWLEGAEARAALRPLAQQLAQP
jgi:hypothetical protein